MIRFLLLVSFWVIPGLAIAQNVDFKIDLFTHMNSAAKIMIEGDTLFAATGGGLLKVNLTDETVIPYTAGNNIFDHQLTALDRGRNGLLIIGSINGNLAFFDPVTAEAENDLNLLGNEIVDVKAVEDTLWVLSRDFVSVYLYNESFNRYQFRESYQDFGANIGSFHSLALANQRIYLSSDVGLVSAPSNFLRFNLFAVANWRIQTVADGLPSTDVRDVLAVENPPLLYVATQNGVAIYDFTNFTTVSQGLNSVGVQHLDYRNGSLYATDFNSAYRLDGSIFQLIGTVPFTNVSGLAVDSRLNVWVATAKRGLYNLTSGQQLRVDGPLDNYFGDVMVDSKGRLWCTSGVVGDTRRQGIFLKTDEGWTNYFFFGSELFRLNELNSSNPIFEDAEGNVWIGSWGGGFVVFDPDLNIQTVNPLSQPGSVWIQSPSRDDTVEVQTLPELQGIVTGISRDEKFAVVTDFLADSRRESIWVINYFSRNNVPLVEYKATAFNEAALSPENWNYFTVPFTIGEINKLTQDVFGDLWFATRQGVVQVRFSGDTLQAGNFTETDNLKSNLSTDIAADQDGYVWVGSGAGLNAILNGAVFDFRENFQPIGLKINDIFVDSRNNKWFATGKGLSILKGNGSPFDPQSWIDIVPPNSSIDAEQLATRANIFIEALPSEQIHSVFLDETTGDVYLGTDAGLAVIRSNPFASTFSNFDQLKAGPNPFIISAEQSNRFNLYNLIDGSQVKILTINGQLIRELNPENFSEVKGGLAQWDGRNLQGDLVATGVYLFLVTNQEGQERAGKILVVHR